MNTVSQKNKMPRGQGNELLNKLEDAGLDKELAQLIIQAKDNKLAEKIVEFVAEYGAALCARDIEDMENISSMFGFVPNENRPLRFCDPALTEFFNREKLPSDGLYDII